MERNILTLGTYDSGRVSYMGRIKQGILMILEQ